MAVDDGQQPESGAAMTAEETDDQVLALRSNGRSFGAIAEAVGLDKSSDANEAFNRALRRRPVDEQQSIRDEEGRRLDALAAGIRDNGDLTDEESTKRLHTIERLRTRLLND